MQRDNRFNAGSGSSSYYSKQMTDRQFVLEYNVTPMSSKYPNLLWKGFQVLTEEKEDHTIECALAVPRFINNLKVLDVFIDQPSVPAQGRSFWLDPERNAFISSHPLTLHPMGKAAAEGKFYIIQEGNIQFEYQFHISCRMKPGAASPAAPASPRTPEPPRGPARNILMSPTSRPVSQPETKPAAPAPDPQLPGRVDALGRKLDALAAIVQNVNTRMQEIKQSLTETRGQLEALRQEMRNSQPETAFEEFKETLCKIFTNLAQKKCAEIMAARQPVLSGNRYFHMLDKLLTAFESEDSARGRLEKMDPEFHGEIHRFAADVNRTLEWLTGPDVPVYFTKIEIPPYAAILKSVTQKQIEEWRRNPDQLQAADFDLDSLARLQVFKRFQKEYDRLLESLSAGSGGDEPLIHSYAEIVNDILPRHLDVIETLEDQVKSRDENLFEIINLYLTSVLNPLGLELIPVEAGDPFDPQLHNNEMHLSASGPVIRAVKKRGYRTVTGQIIRKPSVHA